MRVSGRLRGIACLAMLVLAAVPALGQTVNSRIMGTVADPAKALIPNADITLTQKATGAVRKAASNEAGLFQIPDVPPGDYSLRVAAGGFKTLEITGIALTSTETRDLGTIVLQLGALTEQVSVTAQATPVQTGSSEKGSLVSGSQLNTIALKGRDAFGLMRLLPGIVDSNADRDIPDSYAQGQISINGQSTKKKNVMFDGVSSTDWGGQYSTFVMPNLEAIAEIKVVTSAGQAEFGRNNGGNINLITKSGSTEFHGSGYWNRRHENMNANTFFNNRSRVARPIYRYTMFGYSIGGPITIPKLFNTSRQKLFFFATQEFTKFRTPATSSTANMPTQAERDGNFSKSVDSLGKMIPITDPTTGKPFPGNVIPKDRINAMGLAILNLFPLPNGYVNPAPGQQYMANFLATDTGYQKRRDEMARIDYLPRDTMNISLRAVRDIDNTLSPFAVGPGLEGGRTMFKPGYSFVGRITQTITPRMVNEISFGLGHNNYGFYNELPDSTYFRTSALNPPTLRSSPLQYCNDTGSQSCWNQAKNFLPSFRFSGGSLPNAVSYSAGVAGGNQLPYKNSNDDYTLTDNYTVIVGNHSVKTGVYIEKEVKVEPNAGANYAGSYDFGRNTNNPLDSNHGYANALLGVFNSYTEDTKPVPRHVFTWNVEGYVQDSWRVQRRLTLDVGLRWRHIGLTREDMNAMSGFYPQLWDASQAPRLYWPAVVGGKSVALDKATGVTTYPVLVNTIVPGSGNVIDGMHINGLTGKGDFYTQPYLVAAPRFGFAWDVFGNGKTAVRGSAGVFHNMHSSGKLDGQYGGPPVLFSPTVYYSTLNQVSQAAASAAIGATSATMSTGDHKVEASYQTNLSIQRDIGFNTVVDIGYVGNFTRHALMGPGSAATQDINPIPLFAYDNPANIVNGRAVPANLLRTRYPGMGSIMLLSQSLSSLNYHALQVGAERRLSHGLQFGLSYTFSKALGIQGYDPYHDQRSWWYGPLTGNNGSDRTHNLAINYVYYLPKVSPRLGAAKHVLNDWVLSGITMFQTGAALTPSCSSTDAGIFNSDPSLSGGGARCMQIAEPNSFQHDFYHNFNTSAFTLAYPKTFGNIGLGTLRAPAWSNWDMTLDKRVRLGSNEKRMLRFRLEAYNVFNHAEFSSIGTTLTLRNGVNTNTSYGQYTGTRPPRQMSTTVRFEF